MGAFLLVRDDDSFDSAETYRRLKHGFRHFAKPLELATAGCRIAVYPKATVDAAQISSHVVAADDFCVATGTLIYRGAMGSAAAERLHADLLRGTVDRSALYGHFAVLFAHSGSLRVFGDRLGTYPIWVDEGRRVVSSRFLAALNGAGRVRANTQGVYEYVLQGATFGGETVVAGVARLDGTAGLELGARAAKFDQPALAQPAPGRSFDECVERNLANVRALFAGLTAAFGTRISSALSGGYDSRLLLALALERGVVPRLHVYGRPEDADVGIAKAIAAGEGIPLNHLDKAESARVAPDAYAALVERNYELFDGTPVDGVFDNGTDLASRREHVHDGAVLLNGGGGEVFRNFFYLRDRPLTTRQLVFAFFSRFDPAVCTATFDVERYTQSMADKLRDTVGNGDDELLRRDIEFLYAAFRCRYWMGNNNGVNNGLGFNLTPFIDATVVPDANATPLQFKNFGRLEAAMIRAVNPRLAAYPSAYGHAFDAEPSLRRRLGEQVSMLRPLWVRRYGYRVRSRSRGSAARPYFLETPYLRTVLDSSFPFMRRYFHVERLLDVEQFRRACTLELLFQRIDPIVDPSG